MSRESGCELRRNVWMATSCRHHRLLCARGLCVLERGPMTALNPSPAADYLPGSTPEIREEGATLHLRSHANFRQNSGSLATGAYPGARRALFRIAGGKPNPAGNGVAVQTNSSPFGSRRPHLLRSFERQTLNQTGSQCSERNKTIPVRVGNDADLRAGRLHSPERSALRLFSPSLVGRGPMGRHPSFLSPGSVTAGVSQPQRVRSGNLDVGITHREFGNSHREKGGHQHVCVR